MWTIEGIRRAVRRMPQDVGPVENGVNTLEMDGLGILCQTYGLMGVRIFFGGGFVKRGFGQTPWLRAWLLMQYKRCACETINLVPSTGVYYVLLLCQAVTVVINRVSVQSSVLSVVFVTLNV